MHDKSPYLINPARGGNFPSTKPNGGEVRILLKQAFVAYHATAAREPAHARPREVAGATRKCSQKEPQCPHRRIPIPSKKGGGHAKQNGPRIGGQALSKKSRRGTQQRDSGEIAESDVRSSSTEIVRTKDQTWRYIRRWDRSKLCCAQWPDDRLRDQPEFDRTTLPQSPQLMRSIFCRIAVVLTKAGLEHLAQNRFKRAN